MELITVSFPGGKRVDARIGAHLVRTDQPASLGGEDSAPGPFDLFLASLATCAGVYALGFCQARGLSTEGLGLTLQATPDPATGLPSRVRLELSLPEGFPERYRPAILRAAEGCKVKKTLQTQPPIEVALAPPERAREEGAPRVVA
ncbi:MAG: OsmC family protein [Deltaproteobacteria bacterium]|nr:OsmC family protein [Deltaproteobacteria bacterium]